jgi:hypothetical protein
LQQPDGQLCASHEQVPFVASQTPLAHALHAAPAVPHSAADCDVNGTQVLPLQQPVGHDVASQMHADAVFEHSCPDPHDPHVAPPVPHEEVVCDAYGTQVFPLQQPFAHEVASQTHCPLPLHSWPAAHAAHAAPPEPHELLDSPESGSQLPPLQQPEQEAPPHVHDPPLHESPELQAPQAAPPVPHTEPDCDANGTHVLPLQHPAGHDVASQTHFPLVGSHSCPAPHAPQIAPPVPHAVLDCEAYGSHEPPLQQPAAHVLESQAQTPFVVSHSPFAHAAHDAPPVPHSDAV